MQKVKKIEVTVETLKQIRAVLKEKGSGKHRVLEFDMACSEVLGKDAVYELFYSHVKKEE